MSSSSSQITLVLPSPACTSLAAVDKSVLLQCVLLLACAMSRLDAFIVMGMIVVVENCATASMARAHVC